MRRRAREQGRERGLRLARSVLDQGSIRWKSPEMGAPAVVKEVSRGRERHPQEIMSEMGVGRGGSARPRGPLGTPLSTQGFQQESGV